VYSAAQWEQHKEIIRRLYRDEEKTLDDVAVTMARDFDFHATYVSSPLAPLHLDLPASITEKGNIRTESISGVKAKT